MQIKVDIPDEVIARAQARGLTPESFIRRLIDDAERGIPLPLPPAKPTMTMEEFLRVFPSHSENLPALPDEAFTREGFYQDHD